MNKSIATEVTRAAVMLDELMPRWESQIDTESLDLTTAGTCVLGQLRWPENVWRAFKASGVYATTCSGLRGHFRLVLVHRAAPI